MEPGRCAVVAAALALLLRAGPAGQAPAAEDPQALARRLGAPAADGAAETVVKFSFDQVDVSAFVRLVGEMTGRRFVLGDGVKGRITVVSPDVRRSEVYPLFVSILESVGCSIVEDGDILRVVPIAVRTTPSTPVVRPGEPIPEHGLVTKIFRLENVRASEVQKVLAMGRTSGAAGIAALDDTNHLIVTDTAPSIRRIETLVSEVDRPGLLRVTEVVALRFAGAEEISEQLNRTLSDQDARSEAMRNRMPQIPGVRVTEGPRAMVVPASRANSVVLVGTPSQISELKRLIQLLDVDAVTSKGRLNAIPLLYLGAEEAAKRITSLLDKSASKAEPGRKREVAIEASPESNALLVDASLGDFDVVRKLVEQLDVPPQQVHMQVVILEHSASDGLDIGVEMMAVDLPTEGGTLGVAGSSKLSDRNSSLMNAIQQGIFPRGLTLGVLGGATVGADGQTVYGVPGLININALKSQGKFRVLSETTLQSQDNKEATARIVNEIPITKSKVEGTGASRDVIENIERVDVGIKLKLTPHIIPGGDVRMELNPSIEAVVDPGPEGTAFAPTIAKREVSATVTVRAGSTIVIAGLTREDTRETRRRVPILGAIPVVGVLFRHTVETKERTNLLILVTPRIVTDQASAEAVLREWRNKTDLQAHEPK